MKRREVIKLVGGTAAWPLAVHAQQPSKVPTVGFLSPNSQAAAKAWTAAFVQRLLDLGWIESRTVQIEYRWEDGQVERTSEFVNELVRLKVERLFSALSNFLTRTRPSFLHGIKG